jgi:hypothetical protein
MTTLYASHYTDETETYISIYEGIYETRSTNSYKVYPSVKCLGCVNMTQRIFHKMAKHPQKVMAVDGPHITLNGYQRRYTELAVLFDELGYSTELLEEIRGLVLSKAYDSAVKAWSSVEY